MTELNAKIKSHGIRYSDQYYKSMELWLELQLQGGGGVVFSVNGPWSTTYRNKFCYALERVMNIADVERLEDIDGKPIRAIFGDKGEISDVIIGIKNFLTEDTFIPRADEFYTQEKKND